MKKHFYHQHILAVCTNNHINVDEIFDRIQKLFPSAGRSTIYRNVNELVSLKLLKKISGTQEKCLYETESKEKHAHLINENNGAIIDIPMPEWPNLKLPANFQVTDIRIYGYQNK